MISATSVFAYKDAVFAIVCVLHIRTIHNYVQLNYEFLRGKVPFPNAGHTCRIFEVQRGSGSRHHMSSRCRLLHIFEV